MNAPTPVTRERPTRGPVNHCVSRPRYCLAFHSISTGTVQKPGQAATAADRIARTAGDGEEIREITRSLQGERNDDECER